MSVEKELVDKVILELEDIAKRIKTTEKWNLRSTVELGLYVVKEVEGLSELTKLTSENKIDMATQVLEYFIKCPIWLEPFDGIIIKQLLSGIIVLLNKLFGHDWIKKIGLSKADTMQ